MRRQDRSGESGTAEAFQAGFDRLCGVNPTPIIIALL